MHKKQRNYNTQNHSASKDHKDQYRLTKSLRDNLNLFKYTIFSNDDSIVYRYFKNKKTGMRFCIIFIDNLCNTSQISENIINPILNDTMIELVGNDNISNYIFESVLSTNEIHKTINIDLAVTSVLSGDTLLLRQNSNEIIYINTKDWERRSITEPVSENVLRGPREGFTESLNTNATLLRRKLNTPMFKVNYREIGGSIKTKICICFIENLVPEHKLDDLNSRLDKIEADGILGTNLIEELIKDHPHSIFNTIGGTERPDTVAGKLLEGRIALICDGTPYVITIPFIFIEYFQINEDYYSAFIYGTVNRLLRMLAFVIATSLPAIYISLTTFHQEIIPSQLLFGIANAQKSVPFPTIIEALGMFIIFEILREAGTRMPKQIGPAITIIGAFVLGDAAVKASLISAPMVIVVSLTVISRFALPKMSDNILIIEFLLMILSSILGLFGYVLGLIGIIVYLFSMNSFGIDYMLLFGSIDINKLKDFMIRTPLENTNKSNTFNIWEK